MRFVLAVLCAFMLSGPASAGGMSGGTGIGGLIQLLTESLQKILKIPMTDMDPNTIRRILMRLAVCGEAIVQIGDKTVLIKYKYDQWEDGSKSLQLIILPDPRAASETPALIEDPDPLTGP